MLLFFSKKQIHTVNIIKSRRWQRRSTWISLHHGWLASLSIRRCLVKTYRLEASLFLLKHNRHYRCNWRDSRWLIISFFFFVCLFVTFQVIQIQLAFLLLLFKFWNLHDFQQNSSLFLLNFGIKSCIASVDILFRRKQTCHYSFHEIGVFVFIYIVIRIDTRVFFVCNVTGEFLSRWKNFCGWVIFTQLRSIPIQLLDVILKIPISVSLLVRIP